MSQYQNDPNNQFGQNNQYQSGPNCGAPYPPKPAPSPRKGLMIASIILSAIAFILLILAIVISIGIESQINFDTEHATVENAVWVTFAVLFFFPIYFIGGLFSLVGGILSGFTIGSPIKKIKYTGIVLLILCIVFVFALIGMFSGSIGLLTR